MDEITTNEDTLEMQSPDYKEEIVSIVKSNLSPKVLKDRISDYHENDIADALALLEPKERNKLYNILDTQTLSDILEYADDIGIYFGELNIRKKIDILSHIEADTAVEYLHQLKKEDRDNLIDLIDDDAKREIALIASFDEDEVGSKMTTNYVHIHAGITVKEAMHELIRQAAEYDNISKIYVVDNDETFYGAIDLKDLIIARENTDLETLIVTSYPYFYAHESIDSCIERIKDYSEDSIPILNQNNHIIGVLLSQDMVEIVDDEMGDDYAKFAGLSAEEDLQEPVARSLKKRLPWLMILLALGLVVSAVVGLFEKVVAGLTLIVSFQSLVLDMAGNVGTQSLAVTIRVLMDERLSGKQKALLVFKEARVGFLNGLALGTLSFGLIGAYLFFVKQQTLVTAFSISACTGIAILVAMFLSSITGTCVPMLFKKMKLDPAVASGPLITTINDLVAIVTYYGLAWLLLINVLHL